MRTRTAVALVGSVVLLLAAPFAYLAWAFGGLSGLLAFAVPLAVLAGLLGAAALLTRRGGHSSVDESGGRVGL